ncbi:hypothetical protein GYMLUDRAFT_166761 [Collybiopsis luxurians FD-317 M1]|uniref:RNase H type-1 domain-containing protein n=1 Tax=Collybiopsis luxurians FD-317 M1 TaxID=944289 RepID=A0A0D0CY02_9AGAR|nr:hypothetical protein GYMLUDRAFT_166761 [Collybiopsis luxurians FD-317 M1]
MGFWVPSLDIGFSGRTDPDSCMAHIIFYWEAFTVLSVLIWVTSDHGCRGTEVTPFRLTVRSDSTNTVDMFNSLSALPAYNPILMAAVDIMTEFHIDLRVIHIPGSENSVADALSRSQFALARSLRPGIRIQKFQPPHLPLGAAEK